MPEFSPITLREKALFIVSLCDIVTFFKQKYKNCVMIKSYAGILADILAKLNKGEFVLKESFQEICFALSCDIVSFEKK